jgi:hypothetical protein
MPTKGLHELDLFTLFRRLGLKKMVKIVFSLLVLRLRHVYRIDQYFRIIHGTPSDKTAMIAESGKLVLLDIAVNSFLDVEVVIGHQRIYETATNYIIILAYIVKAGILCQVYQSLEIVMCEYLKELVKQI